MNNQKPMENDHYIMWIAQVSENRTTRVRLYPEQATETRFPYILFWEKTELMSEKTKRKVSAGSQREL